MTDVNDEGLPFAERLERMKSEFLAAQQKRRARVPVIAVRPDDTDDAPLRKAAAQAAPRG